MQVQSLAVKQFYELSGFLMNRSAHIAPQNTHLEEIQLSPSMQLALQRMLKAKVLDRLTGGLGMEKGHLVLEFVLEEDWGIRWHGPGLSRERGLGLALVKQ